MLKKLCCWLRANEEEVELIDPVKVVSRPSNYGRIGDERTEATEDLDKAIRIREQTVKIEPEDNPQRAVNLDDQASSRAAAIEDLGDTIRISKEADKATPHRDLQLAANLHDELNFLEVSNMQTEAIEDLDEAIRVSREAVEATLDRDVQRAAYLNLEAGFLEIRYMRTEAIEDLNKAIYIQEQAIETTPKGDSQRAAYLHNHASLLGLRYKRTKTIKDLDDAIREREEAIEGTPKDYPYLALCLHNLRDWKRARDLHTRRTRDSDEAIRIQEQAVEITPKDDSQRAAYLHSQASLLGYSYMQAAMIEDLEDAIHVGEQAVETAPKNDPQRAVYLHSQASLRVFRYKRIGEMKDLERAIRMGEEAVESIHEAHPARILILNDLGSWLGYRHERTESMEELEEAIRIGRDAVYATSDDPAQARCLNNLANRLRYRYLRTEAIEDLNEAIGYQEQAVTLPKDDQHEAVYLHNKASLLGLRYKRTAVIEDLEESIYLSKKAVESLPEKHPLRAVCLNALSSGLGYRYQRARAVGTAIKTIKLEHPDRAVYLDNLIFQLSNNHEPWEAMGDLKEAIRMGKEAVEGPPQEHQALYLYNLGKLLEEKYEREEATNDLVEAAQLFIQSLHSVSGYPLVRIRSGRSAGLSYLKSGRWEEASRILDEAVMLLPRICPRSLPRDDQQHVLKALSGLSALAASAALQARKTDAQALEILEAGRGIMASLAINSRSDVSDLAEKHRDLYDQYIKLRDTIFLPVSFVDSQSDFTPALSSIPPILDIQSQMKEEESLSAAISRRHRDLRELERHEEKIRELPEFKRFQLPPSPTDLMELSNFGPVVTFNVTEYRSDAFLVTSSDIRALSLPELKFEVLKANVELLTGTGRVTDGPDRTIHVRNAELRKVLEWLWKVAVRPVLQELGLLSPRASGKLPRIWWVTSGLIGLCPLHAAGHEWGQSNENASSHVVSSYTPTFRALAYARGKSLKSRPWVEQRFLAVTMPKTTGWVDLDIAEEVSAIQERIGGSDIFKIETLATPSKGEVLEKLKVSGMVHFACHGKSDSKDPSNSGLFFKDGPDGKAEHLTIRELATISLEQVQMAYLSACSTAENSAPDLIDEVVHVASAFQLVGFPHVIGTFWQADDNAAKNVAQIFYKELVKNMEAVTVSERQDAFAYALHYAVDALRAGRIEGSRPTKNASDNVIAWAPFIHFGC
ncbi:hypothetical protein LTR66_012868 [Elasticomyces elasticus]|nr:hypothetical protein LTR66_012868 [Elasticomyces elasticus]KAK4975693.1 hypothetical protein LTR28_008842 [Elasticomyces elasticus]